MLDLYEYETSEDGGAGEGAAPAPDPAPESAPDPAPDEAAPAADEAGAAQYTQEQVEYLLDDQQAMFEAQMARFQAGVNTPIPGATPGPMTGQLPEYDPFDPESAAAYMDARDQRLREQFREDIRELVGPVTQTFEQQREEQLVAHGNEVLGDMMADAIASGGDIGDEAKELVMPLATMLFPSHADRYGDTSPRAAEASVYQAVELLRGLVSAAEARGAQRQANGVANLAEGRTEPGAGVAVAVPGNPAVPLTARQLAEKYTAA
jgi:hypothetical protein